MRIEIRDVNTRRNILLHGEQTGRVSGGYLESVTAQVVYDLPHFSGLLRNEPDLIAKTFAVAGSNREMLAVRRPSQMFYLIIWRRRELIYQLGPKQNKAMVKAGKRRLYRKARAHQLNSFSRDFGERMVNEFVCQI